MATKLEATVSTATYRFTIEQYERMVKTGIIQEEERVELLEGEIVKMSSIGWSHAFTLNRLILLFSPYQNESALIWSQSPIRLGDNSEPQPDFALIKPRPDLSPDSPPTPDDVILLIEVADSSLGRDRGWKMRLYAREGIAEYWIVNLQDSVVEVYSSRSGNEYTATRIAKPGDKLLLPGGLTGSIAVHDIFG